MSEIESAIEMVTPDMAEQWLNRNIESNRAKRPVKIEQFARDMKAGRWELTGESIKFDVAGRLLDGQNRLAACVRAGVPFKTLVVRGIPESAFTALDSGSSRSYRDSLHIRGIANDVILASVARKCWAWAAGNRSFRGSDATATSGEMDTFLEGNPQVVASAEFARSRDRSRKARVLSASVLGLCHWLFSRIDPVQAEWFLGRVLDGAMLEMRHPAYALRERINRMKLSGARTDDAEAVALVIVAWNAFRAGEDRVKLQLPSGGRLTRLNFPTPK